MYVEIIKTLEANGTTYQPGQIVDASSWRLTRQLVAQRYVREVKDAHPGYAATQQPPTKGKKEAAHA